MDSQAKFYILIHLGITISWDLVHMFDLNLSFWQGTHLHFEGQKVSITIVS